MTAAAGPDTGALSAVPLPDAGQAREALRMRHLIYGQLRSRAVCAMAELGLADLLAEDGPLTADTLAARTGAHPESLARLLRALASFGVLEADGGEPVRYALTPLGATLRSDAPGSALPTALLALAATGPAWQRLPEVVRDGRPAYGAAHGRDFFAHLDEDPWLRTVFDRSQETGLALELRGVLDALDLTGTRVVVDVGGGDGALLAGLLSARPRLRGLLVDRPAALPAARARFAAAGLGERCEAVEGDFFGTLPSGGDLYVLRHILHDWDDDACVRLLRSCRAAMAPGARLALVDHMTDPADGPERAEWGALMDLYMMTLFGGGRERGRAETEALLRRAGFTVTAVTRLPGGSAVVEARPAAADEGVLDAVLDWMSGYLGNPHPELGRPGAVCPFVEPALRAGTVRTRVVTGVAPARAREELRALVGEIADDLETAEWAHSNRTLHTVVAVLPELPRHLWPLLDEVQAEAKPRLARRGMMLGQFHPDCPEPAARNPRFRVSRSPLPLLAIRRMALHDVLFLHRDPALFAEYRRRFGDRYARGTAVDPLFRQVYEEAAQAMSEGSGAR
ncbi:DUF6875 domain-containing protein [Streptomyces sp. NPDC052676]|uniref:DUF6875 domain-containing protein n=1 Tax=Streptomyces sp. NPDC052676 TaxID=3154953 RepID=UPI0034151C5F